jgi:hypothetical protein
MLRRLHAADDAGDGDFVVAFNNSSNNNVINTDHSDGNPLCMYVACTPSHSQSDAPEARDLPLPWFWM